MHTEAKASILINNLLQRSGWRFFEDENVPANIALEVNVKLKEKILDALGDDFEKTVSGYVDYLLLDEHGFSNHLTRLRSDANKIIPRLLAVSLHELWRRGQFLNLCHKWIGQAGVNNSVLVEVEIPLPPLDVQRLIVAELEAERKLVEANRELITRMEAKIKAKLAEVWGEEKNF